VTLRAEISGSSDTYTLKLQGRFVGRPAEETRMLMAHTAASARVLVDLAEVVFVDAVGEEVLCFFARLGAEFSAPTSYALDICERLHLPLARTPDAAEGKVGNSAKNNAPCPQDASKKSNS